MADTLLVRGARELLTLRGAAGPRRGPELSDLGLIRDGALLIRDGRIHEVGTSRRIENLAEARDAEEISATGRVVMPGFVDSHTHLIWGFPRLKDYEMRIAGMEYPRIAAAGGGILSTVRAVRAAPVRRLAWGASKGIAEFARQGTTTVEVKSGYGLDETTELKQLRVLSKLNGKPLDIVPTYLGAHVVPPEFAEKPDEYIEWVCSHMLPLVARRKLARFADVYCDEHAFTVPQARKYLARARELGFLLKIHAGQFSSGGVRLAVEMGAVSADHLDEISEEDIQLVANSGTMATLLPGAVFHLGLDRYAPARALIEAGAAVALATDLNPGTSPTSNMAIILSIACAQMRMSPAEAISAATINGAHALACADRCGSLEKGKSADLIILNVPDHREIPYHFGVSVVAKTMKNGRVVYEQGNVRGREESSWQED
jgi:imidazolonepropionase